jgi:hypothetical protein
MSSSRFLFAAFLVVAGAFVSACSSEGESPSGSSSSSSGTGGAGGGAGGGGIGGAGGGSSSSTGSGGPPVCTDFGNVEQTICKLIDQDCGNGDACRPNGSGTGTACVPGSGVKGRGADCTQTNECAAGMFCIFNRCSPICCKSEPQYFCGSAPCSVRIAYGAKEIWTCNLSDTCQLFQSTCPEKYECHFDPNQQVATCATNSGAHLTDGQACEFVNDCGDDQICAGPQGSGVCRFSCLNTGWEMLAAGEGGCPMGQVCKSQSPTIGVCAPP